MAARQPTPMARPVQDGFGQLLRAEWTKLRTVPDLIWSLFAAAGLLLALALLISSGSLGAYPPPADVDEFRFVHRPLVGDGTLIARVRAQSSPQPWAMAGLMIKQGLTAGAPYAAVMVTPGHGVRMQSNFTTDLTGSTGSAPRWLKLVRLGQSVTSYESADGQAWTKVGTVTLAALAPTVQVGLYATDPTSTRVPPMRLSVLISRPEPATFDAVTLTATTPQPAATWQAQGVGHPDDPGGTGSTGTGRTKPVPTEASQSDGPDRNGVFTVIGTGDIIGRHDDGSRVFIAIAGTILAVLPVMALGALVMTSEYQGRAIWTTLTASPRRGRVLAAKAVVVGGSTFAAGLAAAVSALLLSQPLLRRHGYRPPVYPDPSLFDPRVLRMVVGTAAFLALLALLGLGLGAILRHSAGAITLVATAVFVPMIITPFLPTVDGVWLQRLTPIAGLSIQQFRETDDALLLPWAGQPWIGLTILAAYAAVALGAGGWLLGRRNA